MEHSTGRGSGQEVHITNKTDRLAPPASSSLPLRPTPRSEARRWVKEPFEQVSQVALTREANQRDAPLANGKLYVCDRASTILHDDEVGERRQAQSDPPAVPRYARHFVR